MTFLKRIQKRRKERWIFNNRRLELYRLLINNQIGNF